MDTVPGGVAFIAVPAAISTPRALVRPASRAILTIKILPSPVIVLR